MPITNITFAEEEVFGDLDPNELKQTDSVTTIFENIFHIVYEITKLLICVAASGASSFLIFTFRKFEKVRRNTNVFLLHYAIGTACDMMVVPLVIIITELSTTTSWRFYCVMYSFNESSVILVHIFGVAIGVFWFIDKMIKDKRQFLMLFTIFVYAVSVITLVVEIGECFVDISFYSGYAVKVVYLVTLLMVTGVNILVKTRRLDESQLKTKYELTMASYIIYAYFPLLVTFIIFHFNLPNNIIRILVILHGTAELLAFSGIIVVTYMLVERNKYFRAACNTIFKRKVRSYDEEELNEESSDDDDGDDDRNQVNSSNNNANLTII